MPASESKYIREVWSENLEEEMSTLRDLVERYPYLAMDTEFPGVVARPIGNFRTSSNYHYQTVRCNVDLLKIIQLGITLADERGNYPQDVCTWQFNFRFNLADDMYAQDSIDLLLKSGIDFKKHEDYGINHEHFAELLISSGLVLMDDVKWISFHSGYDFGYLLKVVTCSPMPAEESDFFELLRIYFPCIYDIKYCITSLKNLKCGLQEIANDLEVSRIGPQHQAGSDSLLTATTFFKMRQVYFNDKMDDSKYLGYLYGLGAGLNPSGGASSTPVLGTNTLVNSTIVYSTSSNGNSDTSSSDSNHSASTPPTKAIITANTLLVNGKLNSLRETSSVSISSSISTTTTTINTLTTTNTNGTATVINT